MELYRYITNNCGYLAIQEDNNGQVAIHHCGHDNNRSDFEGNCNSQECPINNEQHGNYFNILGQDHFLKELKDSITIKRAVNNNCWVATVPKFIGLSAFGNTPDKALKEAMSILPEFIISYLEDYEESLRSTLTHPRYKDITFDYRHLLRILKTNEYNLNL